MVCTMISVPLWIPIPNWFGRKNEFIFPLHRRRLVRETIRTMQLPTAIGRTSPGLFFGTATTLAVVSKFLEILSNVHCYEVEGLGEVVGKLVIVAKHGSEMSKVGATRTCT